MTRGIEFQNLSIYSERGNGRGQSLFEQGGPDVDINCCREIVVQVCVLSILGVETFLFKVLIEHRVK